VITDGDLRRALLRGGDPHTMRVDDAMGRSPVTIAREDLAAAALSLMEARKITSLVVLGPIAGSRACCTSMISGARSCSDLAGEAVTCRKPFGARARRVTLLLMDVDGVLTDGRLGLGDHGHEVRRWHVRDGSGIVLARRAGLQVGFLSGRGDAGVRRRARELGVDEVHLRARDKGAVYEDLRGRLGLEDRAVCYIGDDLVDLPVLRRVGVRWRSPTPTRRCGAAFPSSPRPKAAMERCAR
jgi:YrbI family 3-deoxy-D-manno-octulosonate 8-phosphate phosphatase